MKRTLLAVLALLSFSILASAADVTGKWTAEVAGGRGAQTTTFTFKVDGSKLTGSVATQRGDSPITEGKVDGDNISFSQTLSFNGNDITMTYKGVVKGDTIEMTRDGGRGPMTFTAKKTN
jgi:hypothetical protein